MTGSMSAKVASVATAPIIGFSAAAPSAAAPPIDTPSTPIDPGCKTDAPQPLDRPEHIALLIYAEADVAHPRFGRAPADR